VDEPDWVSWRWAVGLGGALLIVGAWLFGFGDPVWVSVPMLLALAMPRLRDGSPIPFSLGVLFLQNLPALAVLVLVIRDASTAGELSELTVVLAAGATLVAALGHGLWVAAQRGPAAGLGVGLAGWCAALVISGWLAPLNEAYYVMGALLLLGEDIVSSLTPELREDRMILPSVATALLRPRMPTRSRRHRERRSTVHRLRAGGCVPCRGALVCRKPPARGRGVGKSARSRRGVDLPARR
jgi:hypothetical protein